MMRIDLPVGNWEGDLSTRLGRSTPQFQNSEAVPFNSLAQWRATLPKKVLTGCSPFVRIPPTPAVRLKRPTRLHGFPLPESGVPSCDRRKANTPAQFEEPQVQIPQRATDGDRADVHSS